MYSMPTTQGHPQRWLILGVICLAQLTVLLDNTVLNVAIPSLTRELHATTSDIQWMINAYSLVQSGLLLTVGSAADRYGRKKMLIAGLALFGTGSLVAGLAHSTGQLIAARAGMGIGGAILMTTTLAVVMQIFTPEEQPKAIGIWSAVSALGFAVGPLIGGFMLNHFWWGAIFLINIPVAVLGVVAVAALVPESKSPRGGRPDLLGALLSTIGMASLVFAIISGPGHGWTSPRVLVTAAFAIMVLASFVYWESRSDEPMLDLHFFRDRRFTGAVAGVVLLTFGMGGALFLLTQHLQFVLGYGPLEAGLRIAPLALTVVVLNFSGVAAKWSTRMGTPVSIAFGMVLMSLGLVSIAEFASGGYAGTLVGLLLIGAGTAVSNPAMAQAIMTAIPPEKAGVGAGINGTLAEFGNGLGVAVLGAVLSSSVASGESLSAGLGTGQLVGAVSVLVGGLLAAALLRRAERTVAS
ncbi:MFS transporter [Streptomyces cellostaticus]|uniref:MFS transporter n=2 Tax=Streptomyces cellostaticus TaxID=67285 RepID=A0A101NKN5_9ACTN|nr:MFS transporter [Streptomyces cellostaticus]GHI06540.1 MFS transporter [Streptomyces cellostaticus]